MADPQYAPPRSFGSQEHASLGDAATNGARYELGPAGDSFVLSHGDLVALSGDFFLAGPNTTAGGGRGASDDLFALAYRPGDRGQRAGTRDEIIHALRSVRTDDPRFAPGGAWADYAASAEVIAAVSERYQRLAANNTTHFVAPRGRAADGQPLPSPEGSAGAAYRAAHEAALRLAYDAARVAGATDLASAMEAAAQHYLSDEFSAGHLRTPIGDVRAYWAERYPLFWYNLRHKIALDTAARLNDQTTNVTTIVTTVQRMYETLSAQIEALADSLPAVTLGDLVAKVFHDHDNVAGLALGGGGRVYGDGELDNPDPRNQTRARATAAMVDGVADLAFAIELGTRGGPAMSDAALFEAVRAATRTGASYLAETRVPVPSPDEPAQNWRAASLEALWDQPLVGDSGRSVGTALGAVLDLGTELRQVIEDLAARFPEIDAHVTGDLRPRQAYRDGFVAPLVADVHRGVLHIVHWAPDYGLASTARDDQALASGRELEAGHLLGGMTTLARIAYARELLGGHTSSDEATLVVRLFETTEPDERREMYLAIEGHVWEGDFAHGLAVRDDHLWNRLSRAQLTALRALLDE